MKNRKGDIADTEVRKLWDELEDILFIENE